MGWIDRWAASEQRRFDAGLEHDREVPRLEAEIRSALEARGDGLELVVDQFAPEEHVTDLGWGAVGLVLEAGAWLLSGLWHLRWRGRSWRLRSRRPGQRRWRLESRHPTRLSGLRAATALARGVRTG